METFGVRNVPRTKIIAKPLGHSLVAVVSMMQAGVSWEEYLVLIRTRAATAATNSTPFFLVCT